MLRTISISLLFAALAMTASNARAGQVLMSCDLSGYQDVDNIQIMRTDAGLKIDIFMVDVNFSYYSLPMPGQKIPEMIDLGGFNTFNELINPRMYKKDAQWFFASDDEAARTVSCVTLK